MYKCKESFKSADEGKQYFSGDTIGFEEFKRLRLSEQENFDKDSDSDDDEDSDSKSPEPPLTIMSDGHLGMNMGGGLSLDLADGGLGINVGGFSIKI